MYNAISIRAPINTTTVDIIILFTNDISTFGTYVNNANTKPKITPIFTTYISTFHQFHLRFGLSNTEDEELEK